MPRPRSNRDSRRAMREIGLYTSIPIMLGVGPAVGWWLGRQAQQRWGGEPWLEIGGVLFGLAAAARQVYKLLQQETKES
ncbi:MAG: AtpZ/AtpI family protein [Candidatus Krumholzibacteria bacterium]|nr:AtpZ/AtpI family protein [Candidatus Krumholzibacteria bacterium]